VVTLSYLLVYWPSEFIRSVYPGLNLMWMNMVEVASLTFLACR
jgi:hypothetical protein